MTTKRCTHANAAVTKHGAPGDPCIIVTCPDCKRRHRFGSGLGIGRTFDRGDAPRKWADAALQRYNDERLRRMIAANN